MLLSAFYCFGGLFLLTAPLIALMAGYISIPADVMTGLLSAGSVVAGIALCFMLAWGLWTFNSHVHSGLMLLAGVVMLGFGGELFSGNKLGVAIFGFALLQLLYLSYPEVSEEFQTSS
jgi:hypothetical protein